MSRKLIGAFIAVALIVALCGSLSYTAIQRIQQKYGLLIEQNSRIMNLVSDVLAGTETQNGLLFRYLAEPGAGEEKILLDANSKLDQKITALAGSVSETGAADQLAEANKTFERLLHKVIGYVQEGKMDIARSEAKQWAVPTSEVLSSQAKAIQGSEQQELDAAMADNHRSVAELANMLILVSLFAVILAAAIGWILARKIVKPAKRLLTAAEVIAAGDLTGEQVNVRGKDELRQLADAFYVMQVKLRRLIMQAGSNARQVAVASVQLHASSDRVAILSEHVVESMTAIVDGAARQQTQIARGHALIAEASQSAQLFEENAGIASGYVERAADKASDGSKSIREAHRHMGVLRDVLSESRTAADQLRLDAEQLDKLTSSISSIARQTNMLALNAAIEASRAGVQGRGFAVVADEIRKLSMQTGQASAEAANLIGGIQAGIAAVSTSSDSGGGLATMGMTVVSQAAEAFTEIVQAIQEMNGQMTVMRERTAVLTLSSREATAAMEVVRDLSVQASAGASGAMLGIEEQHGAMQEIAASSAVLSEEAEQLQQRIAQFRVT